jgi:hypothetical protein
MSAHAIPEPTAASLVQPDRSPSPIKDEVGRMKIFLSIQVGFLLLSTLTGGFQFALWSMLDSALLIQSIGVTALVFVLEEDKLRRLTFNTAVVLYLLGIVDMGINVLISGVVGWRHL